MFIPNGIIGDVSIGIKIEDTDLFPKRKPDQTEVWSGFLPLAEEKGVEPLRPVKSLRAFQARPFSHLGIPPRLSRGKGNYR
jgi:hypothetical protein